MFTKKFMVLTATLMIGTSCLAMEPEEATQMVGLPSHIPADQWEEIQTFYAPDSPVIVNPTLTPGEYYTEIGANNAHTKLGKKNKLELEELIKKNFTPNENNIYCPNTVLDEDLKTKLRKFINIYPNDNELKFMLGRVLFKSDDMEEGFDGLGVFAFALLSEYHEFFFKYMTFIPSYDPSSSFTSYDKSAMLHINEYVVTWKWVSSYSALMSDAIDPLLTPDEVIKKHNFKSKNKYERVDKIFLEKSLVLFSQLQYMPNAQLHRDVFFGIINYHIYTKNRGFLLKDFADRLFTGIGKENSFPFLRCSYSINCLIPAAKYVEAIELYKSVLGTQEHPDNYLQTSLNYTALGACLYNNKQHMEGRREVERAFALDENPNTKWNLACANLKCGNYDGKMFEILKEMLEMPPEEKKKYVFGEMDISKNYVYALTLAGKTDERHAFLMAQQKIAMDKVRAKVEMQGKRVKAAQAKNRQLEVRSQVMSPAPQKIKPTTLPLPSAAGSAPSVEPSPCFDDKGKDPLPTPAKVKKKTKGVPKSAMQTGSEPIKITRKSLIFIEDIEMKNSSAIKIFYKFFNLQRNHNKLFFNNNEKISLHELDSLFEGLGQDLDPSKGAGSHTKITLNFQGIGSDVAEQMIILSKNTNLIPEQIIDLRDAFIKAGIVPKNPEIIEKLRAEGLID